MPSLPRIRAARRPVLTLALAAALHAGSAWSAEPFTLKDIRVEGLQRADAGTVFAALPFRVGDVYNDEKGAAALRALFATGLFKDVRIEVENGVVVVVVDERSVIANIDFVGLKEFEKAQLVKSLRDFGIGEGLPFDRALADRAEQELKRQYLTRSLYGAEVVTTVTPQERNRVNVTFTVTEGEPAKIREIRIVGNKAFSESTLQGSVRPECRRLAELLHQGRPLLAHQAQRRHRDAARRTTRTAAISSSTSIRPRSRSRPTSRASTSRSMSPRGSASPSPRCRSKATTSAARTTSARW